MRYESLGLLPFGPSVEQVDSTCHRSQSFKTEVQHTKLRQGFISARTKQVYEMPSSKVPPHN